MTLDTNPPTSSSRGAATAASSFSTPDGIAVESGEAAFSFDAVKFNAALQAFAAGAQWGAEQPAAVLEYAGQAPQEIKSGVT